MVRPSQLFAWALASAVALSASPTQAHDFWLEPSSWYVLPGEEITIRHWVGEKLVGEPVPRNPERIVHYEGNWSKRGRGPVPVTGDAGAEPAGRLTVPRVGPGTLWIQYLSNDAFVELDGPKFDAYLVEEGLERIVAERKRRGESAAKGRERYSRSARTVLCSRRAKEPEAHALAHPIVPRLEGRLELRPYGDPCERRSGDEFEILVRFDGKPVAGALVVALGRTAKAGAPVTVRGRTDEKGSVTLRLAQAGVWLVKTVHMIRAEPEPESASKPTSPPAPAPAAPAAEWQSFWGSFTFDLRAR